MKLQRFFITLLTTLGLVSAFPGYVRQFPNVPLYCEIDGNLQGPPVNASAFGHSNCNGKSGKGRYTKIGIDFVEFGREWNLPFCLHDTDNDGFPNGEEFGDPCCVYNPSKKSPLVHSESITDASSDRSRPQRSACSVTKLPTPQIDGTRLYVGKSKVQLILPDFMSQRQSSTCICKSLIQIFHPSSSRRQLIPSSRLFQKYSNQLNKETVDQFWSLSPKARVQILSSLKSSGLPTPHSLRSRPVYEPKNSWNESFRSPRQLADNSTEFVEVHPNHKSNNGKYPPDEWKRNFVMIALMDELQPEALHFPLSILDSQPVICPSSFPERLVNLSPFLSAKSASIQVQFVNWQLEGGPSTLEIPVISNPEVDQMECTFFPLSEIPQTKHSKTLHPCMQATILLAVFLILFWILSLILRWAQPNGRMRNLLMRQRHLRLGSSFISFELILALFCVLIVADVIFLLTLIVTDPTKTEKTAIHNIGVAAGYCSPIALAATTLLSARRFNAVHIAAPGTYEKGIKYHSLLGHGTVVLVVVHGVIKLVEGSFDFGAVAMLSGFLAGLCMVVAWVATLDVIRSRMYEVFRVLHWLMPIGLGFSLWHLLQLIYPTHTAPLPLLIVLSLSVAGYVIDRLLCGIRNFCFSAAEVSLCRIGNLKDPKAPQTHILLKINLEGQQFQAGQWVNLWIPTLGIVSHPFSVMSNSPLIDEESNQSLVNMTPETFRDSFELIIGIQSDKKRWGLYTPWTQRLYNQLIQGSQKDGLCEVPQRGMSQFSVDETQVHPVSYESIIGPEEFERALNSKIYISRPYGPTTFRETITGADSVVLIAAGTGVTAILADLPFVPVDKVNMLYFSFRPPYLLDWIFPHIAHLPPSKRQLYCSRFSRRKGSQESGDETLKNVIHGSLNIEEEIKSCALRALSASGGYPEAWELTNIVKESRKDKRRPSTQALKPKIIEDDDSEVILAPGTDKKPKMLVLFCGPPSLKQAVIKACKEERSRGRVDLELEVQSLSF